MEEENFVDGPLSLRLFETEDSVCLEWHGQSMAREPGRFLLPILSKALDLGLQRDKRLVIDFQQLEYLNSSTITPVIRILEHARRGHSRVRILYSKALKWQALSFTALELFKTPDARIDVRGV
ncbi:MAG TPA: hypothetical protein VE782_16620 [Myxococcaceae bacterium]|jgi:hypothetical protein|nr:hypothetical protein [Myxococcaceae bacterium]